VKEVPRMVLPIKYASKRIIDPVFGRSIVKLAVEANRNNDKNRN